MRQLESVVMQFEASGIVPASSQIVSRTDSTSSQAQQPTNIQASGQVPAASNQKKPAPVAAAKKDSKSNDALRKQNTSKEQAPAAMAKKKSEPYTKAQTALIDSREE